MIRKDKNVSSNTTQTNDQGKKGTKLKRDTSAKGFHFNNFSPLRDR